jgi:hypothetical protein
MAIGIVACIPRMPETQAAPPKTQAAPPKTQAAPPKTQAAPKQQLQAAQAAKLKKIEWYATHLVNEAVSKEKAGRMGDAIVDYLQAADMLLLLAKGTQEYTQWKAFSDRAIACQQRVRILIAKRKLSEEAAEAAYAPMGPSRLPGSQDKV